MTDFDPVQLSWLPPAPDTLRADLRALRETLPDLATLRGIAGHALDLNQATSLARIMEKHRDVIVADGAIDHVRVGYLSSGTSDFALPAIVVGALRHGVLADIQTAPYGQAMGALLDANNVFRRFAPDIVVIAFDHIGYGLTRPFVGAEQGASAVSAAAATLDTMLNQLSDFDAQVVVQTVPQPVGAWAGHADAVLGGAIRHQIAEMNRHIRGLATKSGIAVLDIEGLAAEIGGARWFDPRLYNQTKAPFSFDAAPLYGDHVGRLIGAMRGKARKALVLDLDNTLWSGVIGDDGLDGIKIGQGSAEGEAHLAVQRLALDLKARGIVLAVCSKNEDDIARTPFQNLDEMLIREDDIAVFVANWTDKGTNIQQIARTLNIGTDALVFLDDNPAERARVRQVLPDVAVPELPDDPAFYAATLASAGYFETLGLSEDDGRRAEQYRANAIRNQQSAAIGNMEEYLRSLDMVCTIRPFDESGRTRIAQLVNKTNQFNLTTRRYTPAQVADFESDPDVFTLQVRLVDRFGDNGMISVVMFRKAGAEWICDTWLMSCRVLGRRVEEAVLKAVVEAAVADGAERLVGLYRPTPRNAMVADFWTALTFAPAPLPAGLDDAPDTTAWALDLSDYTAPDLPMTVEVDPAVVPA